MTDEEKAALEAMMEERFNTLFGEKINSVLTNRDKRLQASFAKTLEEQFAKLASVAGEKPAEGGAETAGATAKADPEVLKLREQVERLTRQTEEATKSRTETEQRARLASTRTTLREALDAKGIKGTRATAVLAMLEQQGALKFSDDGAPELVIKRARQKGARAEELAFDDLAAGIEDWSKSAEAAEFLPAPQPLPAARRPGIPGLAPAARPAGSRPQSDQEVADGLVRQGVDLDALIDS